MPSMYSLTVLDNSKESSTLRVAITPVTALNFDAVNTAIDALKTAVDGVSTGALASERRISADTFITRVPPIATDAQRENKWLVEYEDTTTHRVYRNEIPCADLSLLTAGSDKIPDLAVAPWAAFVTAWEAVVRAPATGNATNVLSVEFVGKRL